MGHSKDIWVLSGVGFIRLAVNILTKQLRNMEFGREFFWEPKELCGAIRGIRAGMIRC